MRAHQCAAAKPAREHAAFDIYNLSSWPRTDVVLLRAEQTALGDRVTDAEGKPVPSQRLTTGELAVLVESVPPLGAKRLLVRNGTAFKRGTVAVAADSLENDEIALHVSEKTGAIDSLPLEEQTNFSRG